MSQHYKRLELIRIFSNYQQDSLLFSVNVFLGPLGPLTVALSVCMKLFSCKDAAQQVLMSVCPSVRLSVCLSPKLKFYLLTEFKMFQNVSECIKNVLECSRMHTEGSRMFQNTCRMFQNVTKCIQNVPECMQNVPE